MSTGDNRGSSVRWERSHNNLFGGLTRRVKTGTERSQTRVVSSVLLVNTFNIILSGNDSPTTTERPSGWFEGKSRGRTGKELERSVCRRSPET